MLLRNASAASTFVIHSLWRPLEALSSFGPTLNEATFGLLGSSFQPDRDLPSLDGKVILVTGGNAGLGKETILQLAKHRPARIYMAARTETKARAAIEEIQEQLSLSVDIRYIPLDLCSFRSIRAAAAQFQADSDRLDMLILNAGTMGNPPDKTEEGFEVQLGSNHVGHFLLAKLLLPTLESTVELARANGATPDVRIITLSSVAHVLSPTSLEEMTSTPGLLKASTWCRYGASKAANIMFAAELARRHPEILSVAVHPGAVESSLYTHARESHSVSTQSVVTLISLFFRDVSSGTFNTLWAAGTPRTHLVNGAYYTPVGFRSTGSTFVRDSDRARALWDWTEAQLEQYR